MQPLGPDDPHEISGYVLRGRLGEGGMGTVYLSHTRGGRPVALKVVRREYGLDPEFRRRFSQEVGAARRVQGPYTAAVLDSNTEDAQPWLAGEYVMGPSLASAVSRHGPLPLTTALQLTAGIAEALKVIHGAGVIHRDLKPSNVLLAADGPRVIDFGIARAADATSLTGSDVRLGTPAYMAPEQVSGGQATTALDLFALGLVASYAASRQHPFGDGASQALLYRIVAEEPDVSACPPELRELVTACLSKDPAARPTTDQVIDYCRGQLGDTAMGRSVGWWLPDGVRQDVAQQEETLRLAASGEESGKAPGFAAAPTQTPATYVPTAPSAPPPAAPAASDDPYAATASAPVGAAPRAREGAERKQRRGGLKVAGILLAAAVVAGGSAFVVTQLTGDGGGKENAGNSSDATGGKSQSGKDTDTDAGGGSAAGKAKTEPGWTVTEDGRPLRIQAPEINPKSYTQESNGICDDAQVTMVDLNDLEVSDHDGDVIEGGEYIGTLGYLACADRNPRNGLSVRDGASAWGLAPNDNPKPSECRTAAGGSSLDKTISLKQIAADSVLKKGTGLCVLTGQDAVVHLKITDVKKEADDLRTYFTSATQWKER
ncbi:serine/threonine-protein kinase [Streptomyces coryli]|uniref:serine/threonine-protein kinase n=1 Tax=Streptomyces coryli TaxID=1128680 RepID=UPI0019D24CDC|nr:serine/threonine-protein kinase [Streptomyces coryli]